MHGTYGAEGETLPLIRRQAESPRILLWGSKDSEVNAKQTFGLRRDVLILLVLLLACGFSGLIYFDNSRSSTQETTKMVLPTLLNLGDHTRIQLSVQSGLFLRVDKSWSSSVTMLGPTPWLLGSTFELEDIKDLFGCFYVKSIATSQYLTTYAVGSPILANADTVHHATPFVFWSTKGDLLDVTMEICGPQGAAAPGSARHPHKFSTGMYAAFPTDLSQKPTEQYPPSVYTTRNSSSSSFSVTIVDRIRGVNLGGWFIPEVWMSRSIFNDSSLGYNLGWAGSLCKLVEFDRGIAENKMQHQLDTWFTEADFVQMAELGMNSVRVPIGYWNIIEDPYHKFAPRNLSLSLQKIDDAFAWAAKYGMTVLLDMHGAPGSQNGIDHSGCSGPTSWLSPENQALSLEAVRAMVARYGDAPNLWGIELLNEPSLDLTKDHHDALLAFYEESYRIIREKSTRVMVVFNELYVPYVNAWSNQLTEPDFYNVVMDWHLYDWQEPFTSESPEQHVRDAQNFAPLIDTFQSQHPIIVGEWSMSTGLEVKTGQSFVDACVRSFQHGFGYYLWTWKVERGWNYDDWDLKLQSDESGGLRLHADKGSFWAG